MVAFSTFFMWKTMELNMMILKPHFILLCYKLVIYIIYEDNQV